MLFDQLTGCLKEACSSVLKRETSMMEMGSSEFPMQLISKPTWLIFPRSFVTIRPPPPLHHAWNFQRKAGAPQTTVSVPSLALIRVLLSGNPPFQGLHCPHPLASLSQPPSPARQRFQGFMEMKSCSSSQKKRLGR